MKKIYGLALLGLLASVSTATFAADFPDEEAKRERTGSFSSKEGGEGDDLTEQLKKSSLGGGTKDEAGADDLDEEEDDAGTPKVTYPDAFAAVGDAYGYLSNLIELDGDEDPQLAEALQNCIQTLFDQSGELQAGCSWSALAKALVAKKESSEEMQAYLNAMTKSHTKAGTPKSEEGEEDEEDDA